jgi:endonuclease/exonuclease/phosphatase family metal-dependent hydrolase
MGDLNCSGLRGWSVVRKLTRELDLSSPAPIPTYPTWRPTRHIDWILISNELKMQDFHVVPHEVSDHLALAAAVDWA